MWKLSLVSRNTGIDSKKGREAVRVQDVPTHLYTDFCHASLHGLGLLWRGLWAVRTQKSWPVTTKDFIHLQIAQKKEKSKPNPQPSRQHLAKEKILKPYFFLLCSVTTLSFSLGRKCSWEDIWRCLFFLLPWVCLWCLQTCSSGCPVLAWSPQLHHCQMLVRGFRSTLPIPSFSKMPPVLF